MNTHDYTRYPQLCAIDGRRWTTNFTSGGCVGRIGDDEHIKGHTKRLSAPKGWWCAQKRLVAALAQFLEKHSDNDLPSFLFICDDDTFVNVDNLAKELSRLDPNVPL